MAKYNKEQSAIIALWNLALNYGYQKHGYCSGIVNLVT
ncbi:hypothetical protein VCSRO199_3636 [Vibrio cholerae]|nr:hypothetical protein VCSRO199_3636 [Vibrio cholerae]